MLLRSVPRGTSCGARSRRPACGYGLILAGRPVNGLKVPPTGHGCQQLHVVEHYGRWMFDRTSKPIAVHLSCDDLVDFPIEMQVDGHFGYVPPTGCRSVAA